MKKAVIYSAILTILFVGCTNNLPDENILTNKEMERAIEKTPYNEAFAGIAQTVSKAMSSSNEFSQIVKELALQKFDGDYDIMLSTIGKKQVSDYVSTKGSSGTISVAEMFDDLFPADTKTITAEEVIATLTEMYPMMQISVPVHADEWEDGYIPTVVFLDENYHDTVTEYVLGYNANGEEVWVDAINEPDVPIIVISENERMGLTVEEQTRAMQNLAKNKASQSPAKIGLLPIDTLNGKGDGFIGHLEGNFRKPVVTATTVDSDTSSYIQLTWTMSGSIMNSALHTGYYIYRRSIDEINYTKIATITNSSTSSYFDKNYVALQTYEYIVAAYSTLSIGETWSEAVTCVAPQRPRPVSNLRTEPINTSRIQLTWDSPTAYVDSMVIERMDILDPNAEYYHIASIPLPHNTSNYYLDNVVPGEKYIYKASNYTNGVPSIQELDIFYAPYRNVHNTEDVYVTKIGYTCKISDLEGYLKGAPEFYFSVFNADSDYVVSNIGNSDLVIFAFHERTTYQYYDGCRLFSWNPGTDGWMDCVTIYGAEYDDIDDDDDTSIRIPILLNVKISDILDITLGSENCYVEFTPKNDDISCGATNIHYFDPLAKKYTFSSGYGLYINIDNQ